MSFKFDLAPVTDCIASQERTPFSYIDAKKIPGGDTKKKLVACAQRAGRAKNGMKAAFRSPALVLSHQR